MTLSTRQRMSHMYAADFTRIMQTRHIHSGYWDSGRYDVDLVEAQDRFVDFVVGRMPGGPGDRVLGPLARGWTNAFKRGRTRYVLIVARKAQRSGQP